MERTIPPKVGDVHALSGRYFLITKVPPDSEGIETLECDKNGTPLSPETNNFSVGSARLFNAANFVKHVSAPATEAKDEARKVWMRMGDGDDYHDFDSPEEAGDELRMFIDGEFEPEFRQRQLGVEIPGSFEGDNYISLFWGDDDAQPVENAELSKAEFAQFARAVKQAPPYSSGKGKTEDETSPYRFALLAAQDSLLEIKRYALANQQFPGMTDVLTMAKKGLADILTQVGRSENLREDQADVRMLVRKLYWMNTHDITEFLGEFAEMFYQAARDNEASKYSGEIARKSKAAADLIKQAHDLLDSIGRGETEPGAATEGQPQRATVWLHGPGRVQVEEKKYHDLMDYQPAFVDMVERVTGYPPSSQDWNDDNATVTVDLETGDGTPVNLVADIYKDADDGWLCYKWRGEHDDGREIHDVGEVSCYFGDLEDAENTLRNALQQLGVKPAAAKEPVATEDIEKDTDLVPQAAAETLVNELAVTYPGVAELRAELVPLLVKKAEEVYTSNGSFQKKLRAKGNAGRDWLYAFMQHWLAAALKKRLPDIFAQLTKDFPSYANGEPMKTLYSGFTPR